MFHLGFPALAKRTWSQHWPWLLKARVGQERQCLLIGEMVGGGWRRVGGGGGGARGWGVGGGRREGRRRLHERLM